MNKLIVIGILMVASCSLERKINLERIALINKEVIKGIERFIDTTKDSKEYKECQFLSLELYFPGIINGPEDLDIDAIHTVFATVKYLDLCELENIYKCQMIPCQKIRGKRVVLLDLDYTDNDITNDSLFIESLVADVYPNKKKLKKLIDKALKDRDKGSISPELKFEVHAGVLVDSTLKFSGKI